MRISPRALCFGLVLLAGWLCSDILWAQCPMCRTALETPEAQALAAGFRRGILFLLTVPFAAVAVIATLVIRNQRRLDSNEPTD